MINFTATTADRFLIEKIAKRAMDMRGISGHYADVIDVELDLLATHANGCQLRLSEFLAADDFQFAHDIYGIARNLDRKNGRLTNCFLPRYSK